jgi:hypothetical protein
MRGLADTLRPPMVSSTQQFSRIRKRKARRAGTRRKRGERAHGTPKFPIHLEGYDSKAPDAPRKAEIAAVKK